MWRLALAAGLAATALATPSAAQDLSAPGGCGTSFRDTVSACGDPQRRQTLADTFAPRPLAMNSYVRQGARARTLSAEAEAHDQAELARRINAELAAGRCQEAGALALDHGFHGVAASIRRSCRSAYEGG